MTSIPRTPHLMRKMLSIQTKVIVYNLELPLNLGLSRDSNTGFQAGPSSVSLKGLRCATSSRLRYTSPSFLQHPHSSNLHTAVHQAISQPKSFPQVQAYGANPRSHMPAVPLAEFSRRQVGMTMQQFKAVGSITSCIMHTDIYENR